MTRSGRRRLLATAAAAVLAVTGATAVAVGNQQRPPQPARSAAGSLGPAVPSSTPPSRRSAGAATGGPAAGRVVGPVLPPSKPVTLDIPVIHVHSRLQYLGRTAQGAMEVPAPGPRYDDAAWYRHSPTPGSLGPAVLEGHVDSAASGPSVFFSLGRLKPRDRVLVTRADGLVAEFSVNGVRRYRKDHFPTDLVYGDTNHAGLRLLTCGGAFDRATGHYVDNIVVFASLARSYPAR